MPNAFSSISLGLAVGALALALPGVAATPPTTPEAQLATMLARYDAMDAGGERDKLALAIDQFAGQRYATVSHLYWYQNLDDAKAAAAARHVPILALRMLGRLDEDMSCANSRFFRAMLYANTETATFLRDNFVLTWSSERPVPKVTIDFGDGRKIERTTTGNSAHYVLDEHGNVLDVLPGLYAPVVFRAELAKSLALAKQVRRLHGDALLDAVVAFHQKQLDATAKQYTAVAGTQYLRKDRLLAPMEIGTSAVERAQRATYAKAMVEIPDLRRIGIDAGAIDPTDRAQWATVGQQVWKISIAAKPVLLDAPSLALVDRLRAGNPIGGDGKQMIARLEQAILADTALNQFQLRQSIRAEIATARTLDFATLNDWIYRYVFATPKDDAWLGLLTNTDFTALPADGVVMP